MTPITLLGAGSFGTALAMHLARNGQQVRLWGRDDFLPEIAKSRRNERYLPGLSLPDLVAIETDFEKAVATADDLLIVVPSHAFRGIIEDVYKLRPNNVRIAWATKGLDSEKNQLLHDVVFEIFQKKIPIAVLAGPSFAKEVAMGLPTAVTLTSNDAAFEKDLTHYFHGHHFRVYKQTDLIGVQICGAVKNCLAVACGISDGLGYGANARCALITRGLTEMARLGLAMGGQQATFLGLAGVGDLVLTCTDDQSRNRRFGLALGRGEGINAAEKNIGQVVEGKTNAFMVLSLAKHYQVEMPITELVVAVLQDKITPLACVEKLFSREQKTEFPL